MRRRADQHIGVLGDPLDWRISTPLTVEAALLAIAQYDHVRVTAEPNGTLATHDGLTRIEIKGHLRRRVAPYLRLSRAPGPQLIEVSALGRARLAMAALLRRVTPKNGVPF